MQAYKRQIFDQKYVWTTHWDALHVLVPDAYNDIL